MNAKASSFLFFLCLLFCAASHAQQKVDSIDYYSKKVLKPVNDQDLIDGFRYFAHQRDQSITHGDQSKVLFALQMMYRSEMAIGSYYDAESTAIEALTILDSQNSRTKYTRAIRNSIYNNFGIIYKELGKTKEAIESYNASLALAQNAIDSSSVYNNLGIIYKEKGDFIKAYAFSEIAYTLAMNSEDSIAIARTLDNWGVAEANLNHSKGLLKMNEALRLRKRINDEGHFYISYKHLASSYKNIGDRKKAILYADSAFIVANNYSVEYSQDALFHRFLLREDTLLINYLRRSDSIKIEKQFNENKFASAKYDLEIERKDKENALLEKAEERKKNKTYLFILILVILLSIFLFYVLSKRHRKKREEQVYNTETRISKKVHDEVSNDVYRVMTHIQSKQGFYPEILDNLDDIYKRTRDISRENGLLDVDTDFNRLLQDLFMSYQSDTLNLITKNSDGIKWKTISQSKKLTIYRVLQELITNTNKHSKASLVFIAFYQKRQKIHIAYTDNGKGGDLSAKNGLQNVENRISAHKGRITFDSKLNSGFNAQIHI